MIDPLVAGPGGVADVLAAVVASGPRDGWLGFLVAGCQRAVGADGVGLAIADGSGLVGVAAATVGLGQWGEQLQFSLGEGPSRSASQSARTIRVADLAVDGRWPLFAWEATAGGLVAAFCVPLAVGAARIGVLSAYRATVGDLTAVEQASLEVFGEAAVAVLLQLQSGVGAADGAAGVADLADLRPVVHQAAGMVAVQLGTDLLTAMLRLRGHAFAAGRPIQDVATDVVARRLKLHDDHPTTEETDS